MEKISSKRDSNKAQKKTIFINAAEKLFTQKGFDNTSIDEVAKEAGMTKRTLYQYFESKEDLFYAVAIKGAHLLFSAYEEAMGQGETALEKIHLANMAYLKFYLDYQDSFRILNYRPANQQNTETSPHFKEFLFVDTARMRDLAELVAAAKTDGSINTSLDIKKAVFFSFFAAFSMLFTVSTTDKSMWTMLELDENDFLRFSFDILTNAIK